MDRSVFFATVRAKPFAGKLTVSQVTGMTAILDAWTASKFTDPRWLAYMLATTYHETAATMQPIEEYGHGGGRAYGAPAGIWHHVYDGRGDVQLTWDANYIKASKELAKHGIVVDLDQFPEKAMEPATAAAILIYGMAEGWFTGSALPHWFSATVNDPVNARRIVNGVDKAALIAGYYFGFLTAIVAASAAKPVLAPAPAPVVPVATVKPVALPSVITPSPAPVKTGWAAFWAALLHKVS